MALPGEVIRVVLLHVPPPVRWVSHVVAPAVGLSEGDGVLAARELHFVSIEGVLSAIGPAHEWRFVAAKVVHLDHPVFSDSLVSWVAVDVLALWLQDTYNSVAHLLRGPWTQPPMVTNGSLLVVLWSLVNTNLVWVHVGILTIQFTWSNRHALNSSMDKLLSIWRVAARRGVHVVNQLLLADDAGLSADDGNRLLHRLADHIYLIKYYNYHP